MRDEGPLELTRRQKVLMWDGELESTHEVFKPEGGDLHEDEDPFEDREGYPSSPHASISPTPLPAPPARLNSYRGQDYGGSPRAFHQSGRWISSISLDQYRSSRRIRKFIPA